MITNFYPISFDFSEFKISRVQYEDGKLESLREEYNNTHSLFRNEDFIYISPMGEKNEITDKYITLNVDEDQDVVASLIKHIFFRTFRDEHSDIIPLDFYPFRFISRKQHDNVTDSLIPEELKKDISYRKLIELQLRRMEINGKLQFGFVVNEYYKWIFNKNLRELVKEGYNLIGKPVLEALQIPGLENIMAPTETLIGIVKDTGENEVTVNTNDGEKSYSYENLFLQKTRKEIGDYLEFKIGADKTTKIFKSIYKYNEKRFNPRTIYTDTIEIIRHLSKLEYKNTDSFSFHISSEPAEANGNFNFEPTKLIFDITPGRSSETPLSGLWNYGPYDSSMFANKSPKFLAICHRSNRGSMSDFLGKFRDGISDSRYFKKGFKDLFKLHSLDFKIYESNGLFPENYEEAIDRALKENDDINFDLAVVEGREESKYFPIVDNPYYRSKVKLMNLGIPVQVIKDENFIGNDEKIADILGPLALQIYAKIGGTPWVLPSGSGADRELVIGVGSHLERPNLFSGAEQSKIVGITTFFSGDGKYLLGKKLRDVPFNDYFNELLDSLTESINNLAEEFAWNKGDTVRIVFHIFKPIKDIESKVVEELIAKYEDYNIKFAFVTISQKHPFLLLKHEKGSGNDFVSVPDRSANQKIDDLSCLVQFRGAKQRTSRFHRFSNPALIKIHENSTYQDLYFITQQILNFTYMSWRNFLPSHSPVTTLYSDLIADMSTKLRQIDKWNPEIINVQFKDKKWFL